MKMENEKPSEFDKIRSAARYIEEAMDTVNNVLSNPLRVFDVSKCVEAENIIRGEAETCKELSAEVAQSKYLLDHNLRGTTEFLEQTSKFSSNISDALDEFETHLAQFGFKKPEESKAEDEAEAEDEDEDEDDEADTSTGMKNGTPAIDVDTSGIQEFEESPDDSHISSGTAKLHRKLSFDH